MGVTPGEKQICLNRDGDEQGAASPLIVLWQRNGSIEERQIILLKE